MSVTEEPITLAQEEPSVEPAETLARDADELVLDELLVEDVSIDGMCGVY